MPSRRSPASFALAALLLAACAAAPPPPPQPPPPLRPPPSPREAPCPEPVQNPGARIDKVLAGLADKATPPLERAGAVHVLGCEVARITPSPSAGRVMLAFFTLALSELVRNEPADKLVPEDRLPAIAAAVGDAFCDAAPEVRETAERELRKMKVPVAAPALARVARTCDAPRAVAAVEILEAWTVGFLAKQAERGTDRYERWSDFEILAPSLQAAAAGKDADVRARAQAAIAKAHAAAEPLALARAQAPDAARMAKARDEWSLPLVGPAFVKAAPAFRQRLGDPDWAVRLVAAQIVWQLEGHDDGLRDRLAKDLWTGVRVPLDTQPAAGAQLEKRLGELDHPPDFLFANLGKEVERLAHAGPSAAAALPALRASLQVPEAKLKAMDAHKAVAAALALIGGDRAGLHLLRKDYNDFFADDAEMAYRGVYSALAPKAILTVEPNDKKARRALGLGPGPLLFEATRRAIRYTGMDWWIRILLLRQQEASP